jgi:hypothetical protein
MQSRLSAVAFVTLLSVGMLTAGCGDDNASVTNPDPAGRGGTGTTFKVTAVTVVKPEPATFTGTCPTKIVFAGHITTDGPGTVRYVWVRSDGGASAENAVVFNAAGTQEVVTSWTLGERGQVAVQWQTLRVTSPNTMESTRAEFALSCL